MAAGTARRRVPVQHLAIAAAATAIFIGAGSGAVTSMTSAPQPVPVEVSNPMIAGAAMLATRSIYDNVTASPEHAKFVAEAKAAGLSDTLKDKGSYTVFAPTDAAYAAEGSQKTTAMMNTRKMTHSRNGTKSSKTIPARN